MYHQIYQEILNIVKLYTDEINYDNIIEKINNELIFVDINECRKILNSFITKYDLNYYPKEILNNHNNHSYTHYILEYFFLHT
jgi:hypothetical protein